MEPAPAPLDVAERSVFESALLECAAIFSGNRGIPMPPGPSDIEAVKSFVTRNIGASLSAGKRQGMRVNEKELQSTKNSFAAAAIVDVFDDLRVGIQETPTAVPPTLTRSMARESGRQIAHVAPAPPAEERVVIPRSGASDALSHLVFRRTGRGGREVWHPKWKLKRVISGHRGWVRCIDVDLSNEWFVSGSNDRLIKVWDLATGELKLSLTGHVHSVRQLIVSPRHPYLFSCGEDNTVKCWDLEANKVIRHYHGHLSGVYSMTLHPVLDILATGGRDSTVRVWDIRTREAIHILGGHKSTVWSLASQAIEPQLISGSADHTIRCWDLKTAKTSVILTHHSKTIRSMAIHPRLYTYLSGAGSELKIWRGAESAYERDLDPCGSIINTLAIKDDPESVVVVAGTDAGGLHFWDWSSGKKFQSIETIPQPGSLASENAIFAAKFDRSETRLITGECDKTIKIWTQEEGGYEEEAEELALKNQPS